MSRGKRNGYMLTWARFFREQSDLTTSAVAEALSINKAALNRYERGKRQPSPEVADALADLYGVTADEMFGTRPSPEMVLDAVLDRWRADDTGTPAVISEDEFEHDMARNARGREAYYKRQDPATFRGMELLTPDGRLIREHPPTWFVEAMRASRKAKR